MTMGVAMANAKDVKVTSPDGRVVVTISDNGGRVTYSATLDGKDMLVNSALGLKTNIGDFTSQRTITACEEKKVDHAYQMTRTKASSAHYVANQAVVTLVNADGYRMDLTMNVSDRDIA